MARVVNIITGKIHSPPVTKRCFNILLLTWAREQANAKFRKYGTHNIALQQHLSGLRFTAHLRYSKRPIGEVVYAYKDMPVVYGEHTITCGEYVLTTGDTHES